MEKGSWNEKVAVGLNLLSRASRFTPFYAKIEVYVFGFAFFAPWPTQLGSSRTGMALKHPKFVQSLGEIMDGRPAKPAKNLIVRVSVSNTRRIWNAPKRLEQLLNRRKNEETENFRGIYRLS